MPAKRPRCSFPACRCRPANGLQKCRYHAQQDRAYQAWRRSLAVHCKRCLDRLSGPFCYGGTKRRHVA